MKKIKNSGKDNRIALNDRLAEKIASFLVKSQIKWACWMSRRSEKCNPRARAVITILFLLVMGAGCLTLILGGFSNRPNIYSETGGISVPLIDRAKKKDAQIRLPVTTINRIKRFKKYLDSLDNTAEGRIKLDSIQLQRPGLLDSIREVENFLNN